jgi:hypothetical protein
MPGWPTWVCRQLAWAGHAAPLGDESMLKTPLPTERSSLAELLLIATLHRCGAACKMRLPIKLHGVEISAIG